MSNSVKASSDINTIYD